MKTALAWTILIGTAIATLIGALKIISVTSVSIFGATGIDNAFIVISLFVLAFGLFLIPIAAIYWAFQHLAHGKKGIRTSEP